MRRKIPSLNALLIFEAAARQQSFTRAADELALTQSAVCRQIAALEDWLGLALFARVKQRVLLTPAGREYAQRIRGHLDRIERDTLELMGQQEGAGVLELAVVPTFATQWLIPRLAEFQRLRPDITVNLSTRTGAFLFSESLFQAAIYSGQAPWPGTAGDFLIPEDDAVPVCSPALLARHTGAALTLQDVVSLPLLHLNSRLDDWRRWFELHDCRNDVSAVKGARYELFTMLIGAAVAGLGLALVPRYMVRAELESGALCLPLQLSLPVSAAYYLVYPQENLSQGPLAAFRAWLLSTTQAYLAAG
ncbi:MAG: LysR family transcriptional regulator [Burkholderiales bacterium]|nr:LysR family transcriptional regulator [Burkholderiales bacterium]